MNEEMVPLAPSKTLQSELFRNKKKIYKRSTNLLMDLTRKSILVANLLWLALKFLLYLINVLS